MHPRRVLRTETDSICYNFGLLCIEESFWLKATPYNSSITQTMEFILNKHYSKIFFFFSQLMYWWELRFCITYWDPAFYSLHQLMYYQLKRISICVRITFFKNYLWKNLAVFGKIWVNLIEISLLFFFFLVIDNLCFWGMWVWAPLLNLVTYWPRTNYSIAYFIFQVVISCRLTAMNKK